MAERLAQNELRLSLHVGEMTPDKWPQTMQAIAMAIRIAAWILSKRCCY